MDDGDTSSLKRSLSIKFSEVSLKYGKMLGKILHEGGCVNCQNEVCLQKKYLCKEIGTLRSEKEREFFLAVFSDLSVLLLGSGTSLGLTGCGVRKRCRNTSVRMILPTVSSKVRMNLLLSHYND